MSTLRSILDEEGEDNIVSLLCVAAGVDTGSDGWTLEVVDDGLEVYRQYGLAIILVAPEERGERIDALANGVGWVSESREQGWRRATEEEVETMSWDPSAYAED